MDLKSNHTAPVLTDPAPISKSRLGVHSSLLPYSPGTAFSSNLFLTIPWKKTGVLDDVRSSSWLDAMKSSSPTHKRITKENASADNDVAYATWTVYFPLHELTCRLGLKFVSFLICGHLNLSLVYAQLKYPSALASFEQIANFAKGKRIALFLDYDGTLSPIVDNPDRAFMSDAVRFFFFTYIYSDNKVAVILVSSINCDLGFFRCDLL